jgi:tRNA modification GTPase
VAKLLPSEDETIVAVSTAPGKAGIAVVRLSGSLAFALAEKIIHPWPTRPRTATLCRIADPIDDSLIDTGLVTTFPAPRSYTGDDTVELSIHGGIAVSDALISALIGIGARQARAGEFTRRAVLNGKLDLVQAEGIGDLIDATSDTMRRVVSHQLDGALSRQIDELRNRLLDLEGLLAYDIDFPEEDHGPLSRTRIGTAASEVQHVLQALLETAPAVELARDGALVVIAGPPNVGKSSLFNALLGEQRAIVTPIPGTTRDAIEVRLQLGNWPIRLVDTAGLRETSELVEQLGIEVSQRYAQAAHVILVCDDDAARLTITVEAVQLLTSAPMIPVVTKADQSSSSTSPSTGVIDRVQVSARTRQGLSALSSIVSQTLEDRYGAIPTDRPALTRARQRFNIAKAAAELTAFEHAWEGMTLPAAIAAVHVRSAIGALDELIGAIDTEDVLSRVFATFCVGK